MKRIILIMALIISLAGARTVLAEDDFQYWTALSMKMVDTKKIDFSVYTEGRFMNDWEDMNFYLVSPKVTYDFIDHLTFGTNYTYIQFRKNTPSAGRSPYNFQHRLEFEVNPYFNITERLKFNMRNRIEFRWIEDNGSFNTRSRHRLAFSIPLENKGPLKSIYANSEFFYNYAEHEFNENRSVPVGVKFKVTDKADLSLQWLIQTNRGSNDWSANQVFGSLVSLKF